MIKKNVCVVFGGVSTEHEVSKASAATVISNISEEKYNIIPLYITKDGRWLLYDGAIDNLKNIQWEKYGTLAVLSPDRKNGGLLRIVGDKVKTIPLDVIFPVLHGRNGEDGSIQGLFEITGIPYVGASVLASALCMDKSYTKIIAESQGISQAKYQVFKAGETVKSKLGYPCFVKPANAGSSVGISKVNNKKELDKAVQNAFQYDTKIIIEKAIVGRELECSVLGTGGEDTKASCVGEIIPDAEFYDYDAKYNNANSKTIIPTDLSEETVEEIRQKSIAIFKAMGCFGLSRVDFFLEEDGKVVFNEINTMPGFTAISMYPILWQQSGINLPALIENLIEMSFERSKPELSVYEPEKVN